MSDLKSSTRVLVALILGFFIVFVFLTFQGKSIVKSIEHAIYGTSATQVNPQATMTPPVHIPPQEKENEPTKVEKSPVVPVIVTPKDTSSSTNRTLQKNSCVRSGCSGQLCTDETHGLELATTCEWKAEYACYNLGMCERQANGACGWTETDAMLACLERTGGPQTR